MVALPGLCGFFGLWCLHFWVWWVDIWCWWAVGWSWDGLWVVVAVSSLCHVHLLAFPARQVQQVQQVANLKPSKVLHRLEMSPYSAQTSNLSSVNIYQWWWKYFKIYRILWGFNSEGGEPDSSRRRTWRFCGNSAQACDLNMRSSHFKTTKVNGTVSKCDEGLENMQHCAKLQGTKRARLSWWWLGAVSSACWLFWVPLSVFLRWIDFHWFWVCL